MLSTPHKRFIWARADRFAEFTFFRVMLKRRQRPQRPRVVKESFVTGRKPAVWTPWLWVK
jgi:hypothetical protein